jgi:hypothetical protein
LLGELDRLRNPEAYDWDDPLNLLDNASGGKQILGRFKAAGFSVEPTAFLFLLKKISGRGKNEN